MFKAETHCKMMLSDAACAPVRPVYYLPNVKRKKKQRYLFSMACLNRQSMQPPPPHAPAHALICMQPSAATVALV